jgi:hypothetical protein
MRQRSKKKQVNFSIVPTTLENLEELYFKYYKFIYDTLKKSQLPNVNFLKEYQLSETALHPGLSRYVFDKLKNSNKYIQWPKKNPIIKYYGIHKCISEGTWSGNPIVNFYKVSQKLKKGRINTYRFGTNITVTTDTGYNHIKNSEIIINKIRTHEKNNKPIICISMLSPCNMLVGCKIQKLASNVSIKARVTNQEHEILEHEMMDNNIMFVSFPLSSSTKFKIKLFDHDKFKKELVVNEIQKYLYSLIDISNEESTFQSIVKIANFYYQNKDKFILAYHCKSGRDRTSLFDSVVQATFYQLDRTGLIDYDKIRKTAQSFLLFGLLVAYYGTGFIGLKLESNKKFSEYLLDNDELFKFYFGHSKQALSAN